MKPKSIGSPRKSRPDQGAAEKAAQEGLEPRSPMRLDYTLNEVALAEAEEEARVHAPKAAQATPAPLMLEPTEVASILRVTIGTIQKWRHYGYGPRFIRLGAQRVLYPATAVADFLSAAAKRADAEAAEKRRREKAGRAKMVQLARKRDAELLGTALANAAENA